MITLIIIYIASIIGAIISIRYDDDLFDEKPWTLFLVFCPVVNTGLFILELIIQPSLLLDIVIHLNLDEKFYKLIKIMNQSIPISLSYKRKPFDAMDGLSSDASYNTMPEFNGVTAVYSNRKTNIDILGANKNSFDKSLTIFYINVQ